MKRVVIGVVGVPTYDDEKFGVTAMYDAYKDVLIDKGCIPFMITPPQKINYMEVDMKDAPMLTDKEKSVLKDMLDMCDGLIIPGGYLMHNYNYFIIRYALEKNMPILGICLGMQLLACFGNEKYCLEKLDNENHKKRNTDYVHDVSVVDNTLLKELVGENKIQVNSNHMYHVPYVNNFIVSAYSSDGLIEAIELPDKDFVLGVQWHPEKMVEYDIYANKIIDGFIEKCLNKNLSYDRVK